MTKLGGYNKMKLNYLSVLIVFLVLVSGVFAAPQIEDTIPAQTKNEDSAPWTLDLTLFKSGDADETPEQLIWSASGHDTALVGISVNAATNIVTFVPVANAYGSTSVTFTLTNGTETASQAVLVTLSAVNDAPTISAISNQELQEGVAWTFQVSASDVDQDTLTYSLLSSVVDMSINPTGLISWTPDNAGSETVIVEVRDTSGVALNESFKVLVGPDLCGGSQTGDIRIDKFDVEDGDDDFYPKDQIIVEVDVENQYGSSDEDGDVEDIIVEIILFDLDDGDELDDFESDSFDLDHGEDENDLDEFELEIPDDVEAGNDIRVYAVVYEDGNKDVNCRFESEEIDVKRRKHDVTVEKVTLLPSAVDPGDSVSVRVKVQNVGSRDEDDVTVNVKNSALSLDGTSNQFDLDKYGRSDDEHSVTFDFVVPDDVKTGTYSLEISVYDDSDDIYDSGSEFVDLIVSGTGTGTQEPSGGDSVVTLSILSFEGEVVPGDSISVPVKLVNTGESTATYTIEVMNADEWAEAVSPKTVTLRPGQETTDYVYIMSKEDAEGKRSATVSVKSGTEVLATQGILVELGAEEEPGLFGSVGGFFGGSSFLWILADVVLIVLIVLFIKMLFTRKKQ